MIEDMQRLQISKCVVGYIGGLVILVKCGFFCGHYVCLACECEILYTVTLSAIDLIVHSPKASVICRNSGIGIRAFHLL